MTTRRDTVIKVDIEPTSWTVRYLVPDVKELAIYWSVVSNKWCISCECTDEEAMLIEETFN